MNIKNSGDEIVESNQGPLLPNRGKQRELPAPLGITGTFGHE